MEFQKKKYTENIRDKRKLYLLFIFVDYLKILFNDIFFQVLCFMQTNNIFSTKTITLFVKDTHRRKKKGREKSRKKSFYEIIVCFFE